MNIYYKGLVIQKEMKVWRKLTVVLQNLKKFHQCNYVIFVDIKHLELFPQDETYCAKFIVHTLYYSNYNFLYKFDMKCDEFLPKTSKSTP